MAEEFNLEKSLEELELKARALEDENISLEDSFKLYSESMELLKKCSDSIDAVEKKVLVLEENGITHEFQRKS
ncbi:MAG: exodeoxyribonuclease VII small subunit [Lachnospiraceae bacterium]|nr:exodeoxyribonuclease VII small subunit [Lachnospiraceae bacterium]